MGFESSRFSELGLRVCGIMGVVIRIVMKILIESISLLS